MTLKERVLAALGTVYDPELDEPITSLRFVGACEVTAGGEVEVRLRLPTPQCAPNFAFLMGADARAAVLGVPGVSAVSVVLEDHYTGAEINAALAGGGRFDDAFPGEVVEEGTDLRALRELFQRKALVARQARVCRALLDEGPARRRWSRGAWPSCPRVLTRAAAWSCGESSGCHAARAVRR